MTDYERAERLRGRLTRRGVDRTVMLALEDMTPADCLIHGERIMALDDEEIRRLNVFGRTTARMNARATV